eukprot:XP_017456921.1 PREDICTED: uncharacterized protein LOC363324 isoform X3 [Rattus norvegicus]
MFFSPPQGGMHVSFHRMPSHQSGFRTASSHHTIPGQKSRKSPLNNRQRKMRAERASFLMTPDSSEQRLTSAFTRLQLHGRSSTTLLPTWDQLQELVSAARDSVLPLRLPVTPSNLLLLCFHFSSPRMPSHQSGFRTASSDHTIPGQKSRKSPLNNCQRKMRAERASFLMTPDSSEQRLTSAFTRLQLHGRSSTTLWPTWDQLQELVSAARDSVLPLRLPVTPSNLLLLCFHFSSPRKRFGRGIVDSGETRVKESGLSSQSNGGQRQDFWGMSNAGRETSSPGTDLREKQAKKEKERLIEELQLITEKRNDLRDRLRFLTERSMKNRPHFRPNPYYEDLERMEEAVMSILHNLEMENTVIHENNQKLKKEITFSR